MENKVGGLLKGQDLIQREEARKQKARDAAKLYRANKKQKFIDEGKLDEFRQVKRIEMQKYRAGVQKRLLEAYSEVGNPRQVQQQQQQIQSQVNRIDEVLADADPQSKRQQLQPKLKGSKKVLKIKSLAEVKKMRKSTRAWMNKLEKGKLNYTKQDITDAKFLDTADRKKQVDNIDRLSRMVLGKELTADVKAIIDKVFRAQDLNKYEMKVLRGTNKAISQKSGLYFINLDKIEPFIKKVAERYTNLNSFKSNINSLVNLLARLPEKEFEDIYQFVSLSATEAAETEFEKKKTGVTSEEDKDKLFDFDDVEEKISTNLTEDISKRLNIHYIRALASVYGLQLPRRIKDYQYMVLDDTLPTNINTLPKTKNYLLVDKNKNPNTFVFNLFKTAKVYDQQVINITDKNLKLYLKNHIIHHKLQVNDYIFGSNNFRTPNSGLVNEVKKVFTKMFGGSITTRFIRSSAANKIWDTATSYDEIEESARLMGHDPLTSLSYRKNVADSRVNKEMKQKEKEREQNIAKNRASKVRTLAQIKEDAKGKQPV